MIKKGLAFYCDQDTFKSRTRFLEDVIALNKLDIRFPAIIRNFLIDGCGLFYFRPDPKLKYQIYLSKSKFQFSMEKHTDKQTQTLKYICFSDEISGS